MIRMWSLWSGVNSTCHRCACAHKNFGPSSAPPVRWQCEIPGSFQILARNLHIIPLICTSYPHTIPYSKYVPVVEVVCTQRIESTLPITKDLWCWGSREKRLSLTHNTLVWEKTSNIVCVWNMRKLQDTGGHVETDLSGLFQICLATMHHNCKITIEVIYPSTSSVVRWTWDNFVFFWNLGKNTNQNSQENVIED